MLFNSYEFLVFFLPVVLAGFFLVARISHRLAALWLACASLFFYGWWDTRYVALLLGSIAFNYGSAFAIGRHRGGPGAGWMLAGAVASNLGLLAYYKYADFFLANVNALAGLDFALPGIVLPLGISFFTFTQIAFLVDVKRGIAEEYDPVHYLLFVTYFPHLIAGPVLHHKQMMPQFAKPEIYRPRAEIIATGLAMFIVGLAKKVLLADSLGDFATPFFDEARLGLQPGLSQAWTGALAYSLQLYFDFSGYSDMAIGLSLLFGVRLPVNFASPYQATNIIEFWRRWHMTLSAFLRDYLYIPLGGNRLGKLRRYLNLGITMLLGGLWHGANWTFVAWGGLHGAYLAINHLWQSRFPVSPLAGPMGRLFAHVITLVAVIVAWVFFRADSIDTAWLVIKGMAGQHGATGQMAVIREQMAYWCVLGLGVALGAPNSQQIIGLAVAQAGRWRELRDRILTHPVWLGILLALSLSRLSAKSEFLYFQF